MLIPMISRLDLIDLLPKGGKVAEIGVWKGDLSHYILDKCKPVELSLIDTWGETKDKKYELDPSYSSSNDADNIYKRICTKFERDGRVKIYRGFSSDMVSMFPDEYFDWIYIDGDHTYKEVLSDLELYSAKVKKNGFILGHDYTKAEYIGYDFGVIEAVNDFVKKYKYNLMAVTFSESFPSYIISKVDSKEAEEMTYRILASTHFTMEIENMDDFIFSHNRVSIYGQPTVILKLKEI
jgi:hypothetical protein